MGRASFSYSHGDTGTEPSSAIDFQTNQKPNPSDFDWFWDQVIKAVNSHADEFTRLDSDDDGVVDAADGASTWSDSGTTQITHPTDIDFTGDISVSADGDGTATVSVTKYTDSEAVSAVNAETSLTVDISGDADTVDGEHASAFADSGHTHSQLHDKYTDTEARGAIESGDVNHISFENTETVSDGELSRDDSMGYIGNWGSNGMAVLWDSYNVSAGTHISISGGTGDESLPTISHGSTSSQGDVTTGGATVIDDIYVDGNGHVTNLNTQNRSITDWNGSSTFDADSVDGYDIQKNGTDGTGTINFKT